MLIAGHALRVVALHTLGLALRVWSAALRMSSTASARPAQHVVQALVLPLITPAVLTAQTAGIPVLACAFIVRPRLPSTRTGARAWILPCVQLERNAQYRMDVMIKATVVHVQWVP